MFVEAWGAQNWLEIVKQTTLDSGPVFGAIDDVFWGLFLIILAPKIDQKSMLKIDRFLDAFWEGFWAA